MARRPDVRYIHYYTDGSAAYQLEPVKTPKTRQVPRTVKKKKITLYVDPLAIAGIVVAVIMLVLMLIGVVQLRTARQQTAAMAEYVEDLNEQNQSLQAVYDAGYELEDIKWMADALGMVPVEQVEHITVQAPAEEIQPEPGIWERFCTYLTSLFA